MKEKIIIREMRETDLDLALNLWKISFNAGFSSHFDTKEQLTKYLIRNPGLSTVACLKTGELIGALLCGHDGRRGSIYHTAICTEFRNKGFGRMMEQRSLMELKKIGISTGFLFINIKNPGSEEFWKSIGWTIINDIKYLYKEF